jgi:hypothetical protein
MKLTLRIALAMFLVAAGHRTAEASRISVNELNEGGGTIIHDGSADVASSNGTTTTSTSNTDLLSAIGLTNGNLAAGLAALHFVGAVTDPAIQNTQGLPAVSATLNVLRITGTLLSPCSTCGLMSDVRIGSSLGLHNGLNPQNVLFAFDIVGSGGFANVPWGLAGSTLAPMAVTLGGTLDFTLSQDQIAFIISRLAAFNLGVDDVRLGLGAGAQGKTAANTPEGVLTEFETDLRPTLTAVPEPMSLLLFGTGIALGARRLRRRH